MPRTNLEPPHYDGIESLAMKDDVIFSGSRDNTIKKWNYSNHSLEHVSRIVFQFFFSFRLVLRLNYL